MTTTDEGGRVDHMERDTGMAEGGRAAHTAHTALDTVKDTSTDTDINTESKKFLNKTLIIVTNEKVFVYSHSWSK